MADEIFDLNDPTLVMDLPDDYDPEADLKNGMAPPPYGNVEVQLKLAEPTEEKPNPIYFKNGKVIAHIRVKARGVSGEFNRFLKDWYATTYVGEYQTTHALAQICKIAGNNLPPTREPGKIQEHLQKVFDSFGEDGLVLVARVDWARPQPVFDENGTFISWGKDLQGRAKIATVAVNEAQRRAMDAELDDEKVAKAIKYATENPHLYVNPVTGDEVSVRSEIKYLIGAA